MIETNKETELPWFPGNIKLLTQCTPFFFKWKTEVVWKIKYVGLANVLFGACMTGKPDGIMPTG